MIEWFKQFLKPSKKKLGFSTGLYVVSSVLPNPLFSVSSFLSYGWPLPVYRVTAVMESLPPEPVYEISIIAIILNAVFWYLIGCKLTEIYEKRRKQR